MKVTRDRSNYLRTLVGAWKEQQVEDRNLRNRYATWLLWLMTAQIIAIHTIFLLLGLGVLTVERWTASTFITAVFAEVAGLVLIVVKYLFQPSANPPIDGDGRSRSGATRVGSQRRKSERRAGVTPLPDDRS